MKCSSNIINGVVIYLSIKWLQIQVGLKTTLMGYGVFQMIVHKLFIHRVILTTLFIESTLMEDYLNLFRKMLSPQIIINKKVFKGKTGL